MELEVPSGAAVHAESDASDSEELDLSGLDVILFFCFNFILLIKIENWAYWVEENWTILITQISHFYICKYIYLIKFQIYNSKKPLNIRWA